MFKIRPEHYNLLPSSFNKATILTERLLKSSIYKEAFLSLVKDNIEINILKEELENSKYELTIIRNEDLLGAYAYISKEPISNLIYLNPIMLNEMRLRELLDTSNNNEIYERNVLFLCIKLVHEVSQLLNYQLSLRNNKSINNNVLQITPSKKLNEVNPKILIEANDVLSSFYLQKGSRTLSKNEEKERDELIKIITIANETIIKDFGEMIEILLFGGYIEHKGTDNHDAFAIEEIIIYQYSGAKKGYIAKWNENIFNDIENHCKLTTGDEYNQKALDLKRKRIISIYKSSTPIESEEEEEEDNSNNQKISSKIRF